MATADKDGRMAQIVGDLHACLGMSLHESVREAKAKFEQAMADLDTEHDPPDEDDAP